MQYRSVNIKSHITYKKKTWSFSIFLGVWKAVRSEFPTASIKECAFHFGQAVFRKVTELGLKTTYTSRGPAEYRYIRSLMALPFLRPTGQIQSAFDTLAARATSPELQQLWKTLGSPTQCGSLATGVSSRPASVPITMLKVLFVSFNIFENMFSNTQSSTLAVVRRVAHGQWKLTRTSDFCQQNFNRIYINILILKFSGQ
jgi:hypothetical protein